MSSSKSTADPWRDRLHGWLHPAILSAAALAAAAGFAQFGVSAALGDVAADFGGPQPEIGLDDRPGLAGTTLGLGLAIIRLASLGALPLAALADGLGRRRLLLVCSSVGLLFTFTAAFSPSYWWFIVIFALGRPLLSATNALAGVMAAEETAASDRSKAIALIGAAYGVGAGLTAIARGLFGDGLGFRGLFALAVVPLVFLPLISRKLEEPVRFTSLERPPTRRALATIPTALRARLYTVCTLWAAIGFVSGPANMFLFYYGESVQGLHASTMALAVAAAGPTGLVGLLVGRWAADTLGRRITCAVALTGVACAAVVTYSLGQAGVIGGYLLAVLVASAYAPASGALSAELFPTSIRGTVAGWLTASGVLGAVGGLALFGILVDRFEGFGSAAFAIAVPVIVASLLYFRLPETKGLELEESAPELAATPATSL